jgi:PKHD-type hydroxylase
VLLHVPKVITDAECAQILKTLEEAEWVDGKVTAGHQSARAKRNAQLPETSAPAREMGETILKALGRNPLFISAALPLHVFPPLFNRYDGGMDFANHVDNAIRHLPGGKGRIRTDLSATLFLNAPEEYDGGELMIDDTYGAHKVKLPRGDMILYPATSLHRVAPVTRGTRFAAFFWVQSMVRDDTCRTLLFDMDQAIIRVAQKLPDDPAVTNLTASYHNLLRMWADL